MLSSTIMFLNMCELHVVKCLFSEDGVFKGSAKLAAGDYIYKFFVDGEWQVDESQVSQSPVTISTPPPVKLAIA